MPEPNYVSENPSDLWNFMSADTHLKNWKILATGYRGRLAELPNIIRIITLEYYRLDW